MPKFLKCLFAMVVGLFALLLPSALRADAVYTYKGANFNQFTGSDSCPSECFLSLSFTLPSVLISLSPTVTTVTPESFKMSDGNPADTITDNNEDAAISTFQLATDDLGIPTSWFIRVFDNQYFKDSNWMLTGAPNGVTISGSPNDTTTVCTTPTICSQAFIIGTSGNWTVTSNSVPEPSTSLLVIVGLLPLVLLKKCVLPN